MPTPWAYRFGGRKPRRSPRRRELAGLPYLTAVADLDDLRDQPVVSYLIKERYSPTQIR